MTKTINGCDLYRLWNSQGALLYVGISYHALYRAGGHSRHKCWWEDVASTTVEHLASREAVEDAERQAIASARPGPPGWRATLRGDVRALPCSRPLLVAPRSRRARRAGGGGPGPWGSRSSSWWLSCRRPVATTARSSRRRQSSWQAGHRPGQGAACTGRAERPVRRGSAGLAAGLLEGAGADLLYVAAVTAAS